MAVQDYKINYKSDFVLNINGDAGWAVPFCIKFWTGMPSQAYFVGFDGVKYVNCRVGDTPTQLLVMFDDHHLPIGKLKMQIAYHTTIAEFPGSVFDEVTNARDVIVTIDGTDYQVMLDFTGEDAPELEFNLPAYANEAERIQNELQRQQNEADRIAAELQREQASAAAVAGAENVNAQLNGTTLTVTNRNGVSTSVNTKGEQGPVGPEGPQGEQGVSIVDFSPKSQTETTLIYTATFSDGHTQDVAIPKGPKGDTGATGPTGPQGPQGDTGVSITGMVKTGETSTDTLYNITFSNATTQAVAIPKGEKGDQGPTGPQGPQGPMGDVAVITPEQQAAFVMYSVPGQNTDGPMTQKAVTDNFVEIGNTSVSDLNISDENNNVIARFEDGGFKTKKFDSAKTPAQGDSTGDLDITDESGNIIARFEGGHVKTKYFDSSKNEAVFRYMTIRPSLIGGNTIASVNAQGSIIEFGTLEANAMKYIHSRLYNVLPNSVIFFNCDINTVEVKAVFYTSEYTLDSAAVVHNSGEGWDNCSVNVPNGASKVILQVLATDGNGNFLNNCNLSIYICINTASPISYFPRSANGYQHLTMKVGFASCVPNSDTPTNQLQAETSYYPDHGILCLPPSYTPDGEPTRLICFTHGHAVTYNQNSTTFHSLDILPEYWLSEGYGIFDMDGSVTGTFSGNYDYEPAAVNSYDTAYEWIIRHYNVRTDGLFSAGRSQGGGMQFVLAKRSKMPILAFAPIVPYIGPLGYFGRKRERSARRELLISYGVPESEVDSISWSGSGEVYFHQLTEAQRNMIHDNQYRFNAYTMFCYNRPLTMEEMMLYSEADKNMTDSSYDEESQNAKYEAFYESVGSSLDPSAFNNKPFIMFTCVTDNAVNHKSVELFHKLLSNAGQLVQIHVFPTPSVPSPENSDHRFEINTENMVTYTNSKGITLNNVPIVYIEILAFWRKFENNDQNINN